MTKIQISQIPGAIQIETRAAQLRVIRSQRMELNMRQSRAELDIQRQPARLRIDQTECFASAGLKTPLRMAGDFHRSALSAGLEAIASIAQEGLRFLRIEQGGNPIRDIARTRGVHIKQASVVAMPSERPQISFEPAMLHVNWTPHSVDTSWNKVEREVEYIPYQVLIGMDPYPSIDISVAEDGGVVLPEERK